MHVNTLQYENLTLTLSLFSKGEIQNLEEKTELIEIFCVSV